MQAAAHSSEEVKATRAGDKHFFEMSHREWSFAQHSGDRYSILRVMNAGDHDRVRVVAVRNPYMQWKSGLVGMAVAL